jgi:D-alanyl-D-alanine carboxypeptidase (penicillin-binding protein 5/6)
VDGRTGQILYAKEAERPLPPASTAKVMTALLALQALDLYAPHRLSPDAAATPPSRLNLTPGTLMTVEQMLYGLLLKSGNDMGISLAELVAGTEGAFVRLMNETARDLGARRTRFINPHGLPGPGQHTTVRDLVTIFRHALRDPRFREIARTKWARLELPEGDVLTLRNHNKLLWRVPGAGAGKTGYTLEARHCFVGEVNRNGRQIIIALLGSRHLWNDAEWLLKKGARPPRQRAT